MHKYPGVVTKLRDEIGRLPVSDVTIYGDSDVIALCASVSWTERRIDKGHQRTGRDEITGKKWKIGQII